MHWLHTFPKINIDLSLIHGLVDATCVKVGQKGRRRDMWAAPVKRNGCRPLFDDIKQAEELREAEKKNSTCSPIAVKSSEQSEC